MYSPPGLHRPGHSGLEKLGLFDQNWLLERNLPALLLRTLVVGRRQQSESIEAALNITANYAN